MIFMNGSIGMKNEYSPTLLILPMLGRKIPDYPGFRDCCVKDDKILIYVRDNPNNQNYTPCREKLMKDKNFIETWCDEQDSTHIYYSFAVPKKWKSDFKKITNGNIKDVSDKFIDYLRKFYDNNHIIDIIFGREMKEV